MELVLNTIIKKINSLPKPVIVGISGFGGSGKSTFAFELGKKLNAPVVSVDSFSKSNKHDGSQFWDVMDFDRLEKEVFKPVLSGSLSISYGHFDWGENAIVKENAFNHAGIIIVEGVGLFRPALMQYFSCTIWIDCPIEEALARGKKRDTEVHMNPQDKYWDGIWKKNDIEYFESFSPKANVDFVIDHTKIGEIFIA